MPTLLAYPIRPDVMPLSRSPEEQERAERFAAWLRERMTERGVGVNQLHEYADVAASLISGYLQAKRVPSAKNAVKLAEYFHRPVREVLQLAGHPTGDPEPVRPPDLFASGAEDLTDEEWQELTDYLDFVKSKRDKKRER